MDENDVHLRERVTKLEADLKNEVKAREKLSDVIDEMRNMVSAIRHIQTQLERLDTKVDDLESKPAKRWESVVAAIIGAVAGGIGTTLIAKLIGG